MTAPACADRCQSLIANCPAGQCREERSCHTPECTSPATTERRVGHVRAEDGDTWEARWVPMCRGCASDHDMEVALKGWGK